MVERRAEPARGEHPRRLRVGVGHSRVVVVEPEAREDEVGFEGEPPRFEESQPLVRGVTGNPRVDHIGVDPRLAETSLELGRPRGIVFDADAERARVAEGQDAVPLLVLRHRRRTKAVVGRDREVHIALPDSPGHAMFPELRSQPPEEHRIELHDVVACGKPENGDELFVLPVRRGVGRGDEKTRLFPRESCGSAGGCTCPPSRVRPAAEPSLGSAET